MASVGRQKLLSKPVAPVCENFIIRDARRDVSLVRTSTELSLLFIWSQIKLRGIRRVVLASFGSRLFKAQVFD